MESTESTTDLHVRWMVREDMDAVLDIEQRSFDYPWSEDDFIRVLRDRKTIGMVAIGEKEQVVGYFVYELYKTKMHVLNLAVDFSFRRRGVGRQMIDKLKSKLSPDRRRRLTMEVGDGNLAGQLFLRAMGFRAVRVLYGLWEEECPDAADAYLMQYRLPVE